MGVRVNVFTMPFLGADSGPWRKMSRAWPPMSAITTSSGSTCPSHQDSDWGATEARQERGIVEVVRKGHFCRTMLEYLLNTSTNVFCQYKEASDVEQMPSFLAFAHHHIGQEEDY